MILESPYCYWDLAGVDGLQVAQRLGPVERLAAFQSLDTQFAGRPCSLLRLWEGNFRIGWSGEPDQLQALLAPERHQRVWLKRFDWLGTLLLPASVELDWAKLALPKPPHRVAGLANHCAAPVRLDGMAALLWRHAILDQPVIELHMAQIHREPIRQYLTAKLGCDP